MKGMPNKLRILCFVGMYFLLAINTHAAVQVGDFDQNGRVDFLDLKIFAENWLCLGQNCKGDFNGDNNINYLDFAKFAENWLNITSTDSNYGFYGTISRRVLENYLSRSISISFMINETPADFDDEIRMIDNIGAKFLGRAFCAWAAESWQIYEMYIFANRLQEIHDMDPDIIVQGTIFEIITTDVNNVAVPDWVFEEFGLPLEVRNFNYDAIRYAGNYYKDYWGPGESVPDMSRLEAKMWFYFMARKYIDYGYEAIHFGQVELMDDNDSNHANWWDVLSRIRCYAAGHARRGMVLCDAHTHGLLYGDNLLFDFHSYPMRPKDNCLVPEDAYLEVNHLDTIYGKSESGRTPSGWYADGGLPYLVEQDNFGPPINPDQCNPDSYRVWGYDEISWFVKQNQLYRNNWLEYAYDWVRSQDINGFFEVTGCRPYNLGGNNWGWYYADTPSANMPNGFGQEETIKSIWNRQ